MTKARGARWKGGSVSEGERRSSRVDYRAIFQAEAGVEQLESIASMSDAELDALPVGTIRLDREGRILSYNLAEAAQSGLKPEQVIGKNFFAEIAPCSNVRAFAGKFSQGVAEGRLHVVFPFRFDFKRGPRDVTVTVYWHRGTDTAWVLIRYDSPAAA
jgi:photoactive yellow protein